MATDIGTIRAAITADTKDWNKGFGDASKTLKGFSKSVPEFLKPVSVALIGMGVATTAALGLAVGKFVSFEKAMKNVAAVSGATGEEFKKLSAFALDMGSTTAFTAREAAEGMYFLASAGLSVADQMKATSSVLDLAAATQSDMSQSAQAVVNTLSGFTLAADQSRRVADVFAGSISTSQATLEKLRTSLPITSSAFSDMKWSIEDNVAALSLLYNKGGRAETAATGLRMAIKTLLDVTPEGTEALDAMGLTLDDVSPKTNTLAEIVAKLEGANFDTTASIKIFGKENDAMSKLVSQGSKALIAFTAALEDSAGAAAKMRDIQLDSLSGDFTLFKSAVEGAAISIGATLSPALRSITGDLTGAVTWFNKLGDTEKKMISWGTASAGALSLTAGAAGLVITKIPAMVKGFKMLPKITGPVAVVTAGVLLNAVAWAKAYKHYKLWRDGIISAEEDADGWRKAVKNQQKAFDLLSLSMKQAKDGGYDPVAMTVSELNVDFKELNKLLGGHTKLTMNAGVLQTILAKNLGETEKKITKTTEATEEAGDATNDLNDDAGNLNDTLAANTTEWGNIGEAFGTYVAITGEGYGLNALQAVEYYKTVKEKGLETAEAERAVTNTISNLQLERFTGAKFLDVQATKEHRGEIEKREVVDKDHLNKIQQYRGKQFEGHRGIITKATGMIKKFFDWEVLASHERSEKAYSIRAAQYAKEADALDRYYADLSSGEEAMIRLQKNMADEELEISNRVYQERIKLDQEQTREREVLGAQFLRSVQNQADEELGIVNLSNREKGRLRELSSTKREDLLNDELGRVEEIYQNFLPFFEKYNLDLTSLDQWRADVMLETEQHLTKNKIEELNKYSSRFEERLMNDTKMAADYWGAVDLVTGTFDEQKYLESRKGAGGYIYQGMDPEYVNRLTEPMNLSTLYGAQSESPSLVPEQELSALSSLYGFQNGGQAAETLSQPAPQTSQYESYPETASQAQGDLHIHIEIANMNGGDEGALNDLAEDIARRIKGQNITI